MANGDFEVMTGPGAALPTVDLRAQPEVTGQPVAAGQGDFEVVDISAPVQQREAVLPGVTRSFFQGLLLNFGDEAESIARRVLSGVGLDVDRMSSEEIQDSIDRFAEQNPALSLGAEVVGAFALPAGAAARGATMAGRALRGAGVGGATGAVAGAGGAEGGLGERAAGAAQGAVTGAALGAAAAPVVEGVIRGGQAVARAAERAGAPIRGTVRPEVEAARQIARAQQADVESRAAQMGAPRQGSALAGAAEQQRLRELENLQTAGQPVTALERGGGEATRGLARSAANLSPEGRDILARFVSDRFEEQGRRIEDTVTTITGGRADSFTLRDQLRSRARQLRRPAYERAYREGDRNLISPELERLVSAPAMVDALRGAVTRGRNRVIAEGGGAFNPRIELTDVGIRFRTGRDGSPMYPSLQVWDLAKRELDDAARAARRVGRDEEAGALETLARDLRNELDRLVPSYRDARGIAQQFFQADDALQAGQNFMRSTRMSIPEARAAFNRMNQAEQDLFRQGAADELINTISRTSDRTNVVRRIFTSQDARDRIRLALGEPGFRRFEAQMNLETLMDQARTAVGGNSTTTRQLVELGLIGGGAGAGVSGVIDPSTIIGGALLYGLSRRVRNKATERVARRVADLLVSDDPQAVNRAVQQIARTPQLLTGLRNFDAALARVGGQQAGQFASPDEGSGTQ